MTSNRKSSAGKKVLIVDDELDVRIYVRTLFETSGYTPIVTRNGKEGLEKAKELSPDLIILDVMMPEVGGVTMYRELKSDQRSEKYTGYHVDGNWGKIIFPLPEDAQS